MSLRTVLLAAFAYVLVIAIVVLEVPLVLNISRRVDAEVKAESSGQAQLIATSASDQLRRQRALQQLVNRSAKALGGRVAIFGADGNLVVDSAGTGLLGTSYADRPEVAAALAGENSQGTRQSTSLDEELLFTAVPLLRNGRNVGAVRVTQSVDAVNGQVRDDALALIGVGVAALLLGLGVAWLISALLARPLGSLAATARAVTGGDLEARAPETGSKENREVAQAFNEMTSRLHSSLAAQRDFIGNASHQLRTPLTALQLRLEAAGERSDEPRVADELRAAEREVERLSALLANLLTLATAGQEPPQPVPTNLAECARAAGERWRAEIERGHRLALGGEGAPVAHSSPEEVGIVLDNLIENAIDYSPRGGTIEIVWGRRPSVGRPRDTRHGRGPAFIAVIDEGPGLREDELEDVRRRFFRGSAGIGKPGTGLGLAIAELLAQRWGGTLELTNEATRGLRAELSLPDLGDDSIEPEPNADRDFAEFLPGGS